MPRHGAATFDRAAEPLSAVRHLGDGREPQYRLSRIARFSGMAQARRSLLCLPAAGRARAAGRAGILTARCHRDCCKTVRTESTKGFQAPRLARPWTEGSGARPLLDVG